MSDALTAEQVDGYTRHLWHTSQHGGLPIGLSARIQKVVIEMREAAGLPEFGWNTSFPDAKFGECSVHVSGCAGQETHDDTAARPLDPACFIPGDVP